MINNELKMYIELERFSREVFRYLQETLLRDFPEMRLEFSYEENTSAAKNYFNKIVLYVKVICHVSSYIELSIKNNIIFTMVHEAFHQSQMCDIFRYNIDKQYKDFVECNVDYSTIEYINAHEIELARRLMIPVYTYSPGIIRELYNNNNIIVPVNTKDNDVCYFHTLLSYYIKVNSERGYRLFYQNENIIFDFVMNNEKHIDRVVIKKNCVLDYDKINYIIRNYMYDGLHDKLYKSKISINDRFMVVAVYLSNEKVNAMKRIIMG